MEILSVWVLTTPLQLLKVVEKIPLRMLMVTIAKNIPSTAFIITDLLVGLFSVTWSSEYLGKVTLLGSIPGSHGPS
jgi:hypothetical protein